MLIVEYLLSPHIHILQNFLQPLTEIHIFYHEFAFFANDEWQR